MILVSILHNSLSFYTYGNLNLNHVTVLGRMNRKVCERVPKTCALIEQIDDAKNCRRGQVCK